MTEANLIEEQTDALVPSRPKLDTIVADEKGFKSIRHLLDGSDFLEDTQWNQFEKERGVAPSSSFSELGSGKRCFLGNHVSNEAAATEESRISKRQSILESACSMLPEDEFEDGDNETDTSDKSEWKGPANSDNEKAILFKSVVKKLMDKRSEFSNLVSDGQKQQDRQEDALAWHMEGVDRNRLFDTIEKKIPSPARHDSSGFASTNPLSPSDGNIIRSGSLTQNSSRRSCRSVKKTQQNHSSRSRLESLPAIPSLVSDEPVSTKLDGAAARRMSRRMVGKESLDATTKSSTKTKSQEGSFVGVATKMTSRRRGSTVLDTPRRDLEGSSVNQVVERKGLPDLPFLSPKSFEKPKLNNFHRSSSNMETTNGGGRRKIEIESINQEKQKSRSNVHRRSNTVGNLKDVKGNEDMPRSRRRSFAADTSKDGKERRRSQSLNRRTVTTDVPNSRKERTSSVSLHKRSISAGLLKDENEKPRPPTVQNRVIAADSLAVEKDNRRSRSLNRRETLMDENEKQKSPTAQKRGIAADSLAVEKENRRSRSLHRRSADASKDENHKQKPRSSNRRNIDTSKNEKERQKSNSLHKRTNDKDGLENAKRSPRSRSRSWSLSRSINGSNRKGKDEPLGGKSSRNESAGEWAEDREEEERGYEIPVGLGWKRTGGDAEISVPSESLCLDKLLLDNSQNESDDDGEISDGSEELRLKCKNTAPCSPRKSSKSLSSSNSSKSSNSSNSSNSTGTPSSPRKQKLDNMNVNASPRKQRSEDTGTSTAHRRQRSDSANINSSHRRQMSDNMDRPVSPRKQRSDKTNTPVSSRRKLKSGVTLSSTESKSSKSVIGKGFAHSKSDDNATPYKSPTNIHKGGLTSNSFDGKKKNSDKMDMPVTSRRGVTRTEGVCH